MALERAVAAVDLLGDVQFAPDLGERPDVLAVRPPPSGVGVRERDAADARRLVGQQDLGEDRLDERDDGGGGGGEEEDGDRRQHPPGRVAAQVVPEEGGEAHAATPVPPRGARSRRSATSRAARALAPPAPRRPRSSARPRRMSSMPPGAAGSASRRSARAATRWGAACPWISSGTTRRPSTRLTRETSSRRT